MLTKDNHSCQKVFLFTHPQFRTIRSTEQTLGQKNNCEIQNNPSRLHRPTWSLRVATKRDGCPLAPRKVIHNLINIVAVCIKYVRNERSHTQGLNSVVFLFCTALIFGGEMSDQTLSFRITPFDNSSFIRQMLRFDRCLKMLFELLRAEFNYRQCVCRAERREMCDKREDFWRKRNMPRLEALR
jgi:hypothetical protein